MKFRRALVGLALLALQGCSAANGYEAAYGCDFEPRASLAVAMRRNVPIINADINGYPVSLVLDTGAERSMLTNHVVQLLKLPRDSAQYSDVVGIGGRMATEDATVGSWRLAGLSLPTHTVVVGEQVPAGADGRLGMDVLSHFDIDLDLPNRRVTLFRQRACSESGPEWADSYIKAQVSQRGFLMVPTLLDGKLLLTLVDSGSETTAVAERAMQDLRLARSNWRNDPVVEVGGVVSGRRQARLHRFHQMFIGPLVLRDFVGDALLGMDVLRSRRILLSGGSDRLWLSARADAPFRRDRDISSAH
jgi:predicted aspartyl protease